MFSPDGQYVAFFSDREPPGIYRKPSDGSRAEEMIGATGVQTWPRDWSSDGRFILYDKGQGSSDIWVLPLEGADRKPTPYLATTFSEAQGHISPNMKWVAYVVG